MVNSVIIPNQNLYDFIIIFRSVWKRTVCAYLDFFAILLYVGLTSGTVWHTIHRTITKQTIKVIQKSLVTRKIFAIFVFKVFIRVFHFYSFYIHMLFSQSSLQNADLTDNTGAYHAVVASACGRLGRNTIGSVIGAVVIMKFMRLYFFIWR